MKGKNIVNGPLPFVFNLDAKQIQERYWVRQVASPNPELIVVEAWPKVQELRAQYKLVQIALDEKTYQPHALLMYAPNFHPKTAPKWDHYEFRDIKRNAIGAGFSKFLGNFIPKAPPAELENSPTSIWSTARSTTCPATQATCPAIHATCPATGSEPCRPERLAVAHPAQQAVQPVECCR